MTAAQFELLDQVEAEALLVSRFQKLVAAGYPPEQAATLAASLADLQLAADLLQHGCPAATAIRILL